jgi:hypothetical protein
MEEVACKEVCEYKEEGYCKQEGCCKANIGCTNVSRGNGRGGLLRIVKEKKTAAGEKFQADAIKYSK